MEEKTTSREGKNIQILLLNEIFPHMQNNVCKITYLIVAAGCALHTSHSVYYTLKKHITGMCVHMLFAYFITHIHILENSSILENKFLEN